MLCLSRLTATPSSFIPTCAECSTTYPQPGVTAVRGDASFALCRSCHQKMTFRLPEIKFLRTGPSGLALKATTGRKKVRSDMQGISRRSQWPAASIGINNTLSLNRMLPVVPYFQHPPHWGVLQASITCCAWTPHNSNTDGD